MPDDKNKGISDQTRSSQSVPSNTEINETVTARMLQIAGAKNDYIPTQAQVDKILELQEKGMDYTHDERTRFSPKRKADLILAIIVIVTFLIIFILALFFAKEYLGEIITGFVGLLTGGIGGYSYAQVRKDN